MPEFVTKTAAKLLGVSQRQLRYWDSRGLLSDKPSFAVRKRSRENMSGRPPGSTNRHFDLDDLIVAVIVRDLLKANLPTEQAQRVFPMLRRHRELFGNNKSLCEALLKVPSFLLTCRDYAMVETENRVWQRVKTMIEGSTPVTILDLSKVARVVLERCALETQELDRLRKRL